MEESKGPAEEVVCIPGCTDTAALNVGTNAPEGVEGRMEECRYHNSDSNSVLYRCSVWSRKFHSEKSGEGASSSTILNYVPSLTFGRPFHNAMKMVTIGSACSSVTERGLVACMAGAVFGPTDMVGNDIRPDLPFDFEVECWWMTDSYFAKWTGMAEEAGVPRAHSVLLHVWPTSGMMTSTDGGCLVPT